MNGSDLVLNSKLACIVGWSIALMTGQHYWGRRHSLRNFQSNVRRSHVQYVASTFILALNWWLESKSPLVAEQVNDLFRPLILPTLAAVWEWQRYTLFYADFQPEPGRAFLYSG